MTQTQKNTAEDHSQHCPLCFCSGPFERLVGPLAFVYHLCANCALIFMDRAFLPDQLAEKERYQTHQNSPQNAGYVQFLEQAIAPTLPYLETDMHGLDYGCGPGPTLSLLLQEEGLHCENYDPFFYPHLPNNCFDFIFATEAAEHFFFPGKELRRIQSLLKPGGIFTLMTEAWDNLANFSDWYYAKDFTHVCFFHANTIDYLCEQFGFAALDRKNPRVSVLRVAQSACT